MAVTGTGAVFFLGNRTHYDVLEQSNNFDVENGNTSTETIYQNQSVEELWPNEKTNQHGDFDANYNLEPINWNFSDQSNDKHIIRYFRQYKYPKQAGIEPLTIGVYSRVSINCAPTVVNTGTSCQYSMFINERSDTVGCVKRRVKRNSSQTLLCDEKPVLVKKDDCKEEPSKSKPRGVSILSFLASLARRKRNDDTDNVQYLKHYQSELINCTYRESCRCLDCQSRYFECEEDSDDYSSDDDFSPYSIQDVEKQTILELEDDVFINTTNENDNASTDLLLDDHQEVEQSVPEVLEDEDTDKQLQMEVAASTSAMFNILLYHPFSCNIQ